MSIRRYRDDPYESYSEAGHQRTLARGWAKIHEGCGGLCRYVEAVDVVGTGWTCECLHCEATNIPDECVVFVTDPAVPLGGDATTLRKADPRLLRDLSYPTETQESEGFAAAQEELRDQLQEVF